MYGTLSEIALVLKLGIPVVGLHTWRLRQPKGRAACRSWSPRAPSRLSPGPPGRHRAAPGARRWLD
jgi:hypothetical protein